MSDNYDDVIWVCPRCGDDMPNEQTCTNCGDVDGLDVWDDDDKLRCPTCDSVLDSKEENHPAPYWCPSCRAYWAFGE